jgi:hypothetical protein
MDGWLMVPPEAVQSEPALAAWFERSVLFAKTLPPK